ncbi:MAG: pyridoxal-phosphate dependent enzyme, partial [Clostridia bacterium]|nr:pyridoxal-phosphate dependent enzyme [Clostridia bacterium]
MDRIKWTLNAMPKSDDRYLPLMSAANVDQAWAFFRSFPQYAVTPLARLEGMADRLGLGGLFVKDESHRFGLNAVKALRGAVAMATTLAAATTQGHEARTYDDLTGAQLRQDVGQATFFTATDGNHGRGVA